MVKEAFVDPALGRDLLLSSANSINVGRLLPQMAYYAKSSLELYRRDGRAPNYIVPSGNLGNVAACLWARRAGLPIGEVVLATNANLTVPDFLRTGEWQPRASLATLASAMDVGNPSNMERLRWLFPDVRDLRGASPRTPSAMTKSEPRSGVITPSSGRRGVRTPRLRPMLPAAAGREAQGTLGARRYRASGQVQ